MRLPPCAWSEQSEETWCLRTFESSFNSKESFFASDQSWRTGTIIPQLRDGESCDHHDLETTNRKMSRKCFQTVKVLYFSRCLSVHASIWIAIARANKRNQLKTAVTHPTAEECTRRVRVAHCSQEKNNESSLDDCTTTKRRPRSSNRREEEKSHGKRRRELYSP